MLEISKNWTTLRVNMRLKNNQLLNRWCCILMLLVLSQPLLANSMYTNGKIYVVIAVIAVIFLGLLLFLVYLERRLTKLEDQILEDE